MYRVISSEVVTPSAASISELLNETVFSSEKERQAAKHRSLKKTGYFSPDFFDTLTVARHSSKLSNKNPESSYVFSIATSNPDSDTFHFFEVTPEGMEAIQRCIAVIRAEKLPVFECLFDFLTCTKSRPKYVLNTHTSSIRYVLDDQSKDEVDNLTQIMSRLKNRKN